MRYYITKLTRYEPFPYAGMACETAGVEPGKYYSDLREAEADALKLCNTNPVGFVVREVSESLGEQMSITRNNEEIKCPVTGKTLMTEGEALDAVKAKLARAEAVIAELETAIYLGLPVDLQNKAIGTLKQYREKK